MSKPELVYVEEIKAPPERVWQALTDPAFTAHYWYGTRLESDWKAGSPITFHKAEGMGPPDTGTVIVADRPRKLAYAWVVNFPPLAGERASRVTFTLEPIGAGTKLTLVHDDFPEGSKVFAAMQNGWKQIIPGLKKMLESTP